MEQFLEKLFESGPKVRVMRLFLRNPELSLTVDDIVRRAQVKAGPARREIKKFLEMKLIHARRGVLRQTIKRDGKQMVRAKKADFYSANQNFRLFNELRELLTKDAVASRKKLIEKTKRLGSVKLLLLSGAFLNSEKSRTDLLIVGDAIRRSGLERVLAEAESEIGRPLQYTLMETKEFEYRTSMYDRFLRDILEYPHETLINKIEDLKNR